MANKPASQVKQIEAVQLLNQLKQLKHVLAHINRFSADQNNYFTDKNQKIDIRMQINNRKSEVYLAQKKQGLKAEILHESLLDILSEHVQIHHLKFVLVQEYLEDLYKRFETIGKSVNKSLDPLMNYLEANEIQGFENEHSTN